MKRMFILGIILGASAIVSCSPDGIPVQWTEPNAKYEGRVVPGYYDITQSQVNCCKPGNNCATREIRDVAPFTTTLRTYILNDNLKGFFQHENWQAEFPELVSHPEVVNYVLANNPKSRIVSNGEGGESYVIFKERNLSEMGTANVLFALSTAKNRSCDDGTQ